MWSYFRSYVEILKSELDRLDFETFVRIIDILLVAREKGKKIFIIGNGGSAATASHFVCDLSKGTALQDPLFKRFRAFSLADNLSLLTAVGNDISYDHIFAEQLITYLDPGDVVIALSASGNSPNIVRAISFAKEAGATTIGLLGFGGGQAGKMVDYALVVGSKNYGISEDFHLIIEHILTQTLKKILSQQKKKVIFLDRDGVINYKAPEHDYIRNWSQFRFFPSVFEALRELQNMGYRFIVATNQRGIARGLLSEEDLEEIHRNMLERFQKEDIEIDAIYYCPHDHKEKCLCRKPNPGMFYKAQTELPYLIDFSRSIVVGDSPTDIKAGKKLGAQTAFIRNRNGDLSMALKADFTARDLRELVQLLKKAEPSHKEAPVYIS